MSGGRTQYTGGYVLQPEAGVYKKIVVLDFRSLYPSIIITHNIDVSTLKEKKPVGAASKVPGFDRWFLRKPQGSIPKRIKKILKQRAEIKRLISKTRDPKKKAKLIKKEQGLKLAANINYGMFGYRAGPDYNVKVAESISAFGRYYIKGVISRARKNGFKVIYGDTDSVFLIGTEGKAKAFTKKMNKWLPGQVKIEYRGFYKRGLFVTAKHGQGSKKKYALLKGTKLEIRGFETRRGDWCELAKETQYEILGYVLKEQNVKKAVKFVRQELAKLRKRKYPVSKLTINVYLSRPLEEYRAIGPHIAVAHMLELTGRELGEGDLISYVITKGKGRISDRAIPAKGAKVSQIDVEYYANNQIIPAALRVLRVFGVKESDLK